MTRKPLIMSQITKSQSFRKHMYYKNKIAFLHFYTLKKVYQVFCKNFVTL